MSVIKKIFLTSIISGLFFSVFFISSIVSASDRLPSIKELNNSQNQLQSLTLAKQKINHFQWFVVDGMFSDVVTTEVSLIPQLLKSEYQVQDVVLMTPSSFHGLENQINYLYQLIQQNYRKTNKKIIFLAQSRGAHILFHTFLKHPDLVDITYKTVYIQGAFYGSPLADVSLDSVKQIAKIKTPLQDDIQELVDLLSPSAEDMRTETARLDLILNIQAAYKIAPDKMKELKNNFWFIRSQKPTYLLHKNLIPAGAYLSHYYGENDGVVLTKQQLVPGWGVDLGVISMGHLFVAKDPTQPSPDTRRLLENIMGFIVFDLAL
jgi:hypothetical protein